jgi:hypothetical protein
MGAKDSDLVREGHTDAADLTLSTDIDTGEVFVANNPRRACRRSWRPGAHPGRHDEADDGAGPGRELTSQALQSITA